LTSPPGENLDLKWTGWEIDPERKTTYLREDEWLTQPNNIKNHFSRVSPSSGYILKSDGWEIMACLKYKDSSEVPYLLLHKVGNGFLVITSAEIGYGGGWYTFGTPYYKEAGMLIENLYNMFLKDLSMVIF